MIYYLRPVKGFALGFLIYIFLGYFWPYLSFKQNMFIATFKTTIELPSIIKYYVSLTTKFNRIHAYIIGGVDFVNQTYGPTVNITRNEIINMTTPRLSGIKSGIVLGIPILMALDFFIPYIVYKILLWKGFYKLMPYNPTSKKIVT